MSVVFLHDAAILAELHKRNKKHGPLDMAVAYWGTDAIGRLGLDDDLSQVRIICDPWGGFCDAKSLEMLLDAGASIRTIPNFHAKTYIYLDTVVVGSANVSAMGLGSRTQPPTRMEAAVATDDLSVVNATKAWFGLAWEKGTIFGPEMLPAVAALRRRRLAVERQALPSLLHAIANEGSLFRGMDVRVIVYKGESTKAAHKAWESSASAHYSEADRAMYEAEGETPYYEDDPSNVGEYAPGLIYIDYQLGARGGMTYGGIWQVKANPIVRVPKAGTIIGLLDRLPAIAGRKAKAAEMAAFGREIARMIEGKEEGNWSVRSRGVVAAAKRALQA